MTKQLLGKYYLHLEQDNSARGSQFSPGYVTMVTRTFSVLIQACLDRSNRKLRSRNSTLLDQVKVMGQTCAQKRAEQGPSLPHAPPDLPEPLNVHQLLASLKAWDQKIKNLDHKITNLHPNAPAKNALYMRYKAAMLRAAKLTFGFIFQTCERLHTAHNLAAWHQEFSRLKHLNLPLCQFEPSA